MRLWYRSFWSDWTTAFLSDEISKSDVKETKFINENGEEENIFYAESRLEINDDELNERFHYINACLYTEIEFDWNWDLKKISGVVIAGDKTALYDNEQQQKTGLK